jgi:hypothetical protein
MNPQTIKAFSHLSETEREVRDRFYWFDALDSEIESANATKEDIRKAYIDVMLSEMKISEYTPVHFQIQYLLDQVHIACNKILEFSEAKFPWIGDVFLKQVEEVAILSHYLNDIRRALREWDKIYIRVLFSFQREKVFVFDFREGMNEQIFEVLDALLYFFEKQEAEGNIPQIY